MNLSPFEKMADPPIAVDTPALRLLTGYLWILRDGRLLQDPVLNPLAVAHIRDLLGLVLGTAAGEQANRRAQAVRLRDIKIYIAENLGEPLSLAAAAARQGVTPRYVRRLFEQEGTSFTRYVLEQRLAAAHRMLRDPHLADRPITSIAYDVGFGDLSYFNRCFRRRFGNCPSVIRAEARLGGRAAPKLALVAGGSDAHAGAARNDLVDRSDNATLRNAGTSSESRPVPSCPSGAAVGRLS